MFRTTKKIHFKSEMIEQRFFFARHAETDWNRKKLCQGQKDIPLNEAGLLEAKAFALKYCHLNIECIVSSPLTRALQTAQEFQKVHPQAPLYFVEELKERSWGELEGMSSQRMYQIEEQEEQDPLYTPGHKVEPRDVFRKRVLAALAKAQSYHPHPLMISHGRVFMEFCLGLGIEPIRQIPHCQLYEISLSASGWVAKPYF